ncbi:MAG: DUF2208 domain-containing protein [Thermoprotei archaeon]|nr:MAG: DUF2208 domain-containing protein [Thermoprotei archaeon]
MMRQPSRKYTVGLSQASILVMSLISTFLPPEYRTIVFILYFIAIMGFMFKKSKTWDKIPPKKELGPPLFKEPNAMKVAMLDKNLMNELKKQVTASFSLLLLSLFVLILFPFYNSTIYPMTWNLLIELTNNEILASFLSILIMYEFIFGILTLMRLAIMSKVKFMNILLPQRFIVYKRGVVINDKFFVEFSKKYCIEHNSSARYVEVREKSGSGTRIRLYSDASSQLRSKLFDLGLDTC